MKQPNIETRDPLTVQRDPRLTTEEERQRLIERARRRARKKRKRGSCKNDLFGKFSSTQVPRIVHRLSIDRSGNPFLPL